MRSSKVSRGHGEPGANQCAQLVAREQDHRRALARLRQGLRMFHIRRCEHFGLAARGNLVLEQAGRAEFGLHLEACGFLERLADFRKGSAQAAGGMQEDGFRRIR